MDFGFSDEQDMLRQTARAFLEEHCPTTFVRADDGRREGLLSKPLARDG
jgi:alkylation response protein AidB-like acyl-CoA dehydrogenase